MLVLLAKMCRHAAPDKSVSRRIHIVDLTKTPAPPISACNLTASYCLQPSSQRTSAHLSGRAAGV